MYCMVNVKEQFCVLSLRKKTNTYAGSTLPMPYKAKMKTHDGIIAEYVH